MGGGWKQWCDLIPSFGGRSDFPFSCCCRMTSKTWTRLVHASQGYILKFQMFFLRLECEPLNSILLGFFLRSLWHYSIPKTWPENDPKSAKLRFALVLIFQFYFCIFPQWPVVVTPPPMPLTQRVVDTPPRVKQCFSGT